ncbi:MAG TPA: hypothetical protein VFK40_12090, partial [Nitrososphaeraceae archaeon]|nr:hypothetical protein [Nitrososphaeraceae archaeon]
MRILIGLQSLNNHILDHQNYHKLQGFVYEQLISKTSFKDIHNTKTYKYFSYSNIFPNSIVKSGEIKYLIFSSPNYQLIQSIFKIIENILFNETIISIGEQQYKINSAVLI